MDGYCQIVESVNIQRISQRANVTLGSYDAGLVRATEQGRDDDGAQNAYDHDDHENLDQRETSYCLSAHHVTPVGSY